jgi:hypothetical protein
MSNPVEEGRIKKGGQNPPTPTIRRPAPPMGSGGNRELIELRRKAAILDRAIEDINWMLNNQRLLNPCAFEYLNEVQP